MPKTIKLGENVTMDVCDECLKFACIHFEVLKRQKRMSAHY